MKKIFTLIIIACAGTVFSQSFSAYRMNNSAQTGTVQTLTNGGSTGETTAATTDTNSPYKSEFFIKLINNSATTLTLSVIRSVVLQSPTLFLDGSSNLPNSYFCFGTSCFGSNINTPPSTDYCPLGVSGTTLSPYDNSRNNGTPFVVDLVEGLSVGEYLIKYKLYNIANPNDTLTFTVEYNKFLSVHENVDVIENVGNLYPNPSTNNAQFSLSLKQESAVKIQVFNSLGALVYNGSEQKLSGKNKLNIDCTNFNSGLYFVSVTAGNSKVTKRLVVNK